MGLAKTMGRMVKQAKAKKIAPKKRGLAGMVGKAMGNRLAQSKKASATKSGPKLSPMKKSAAGTANRRRRMAGAQNRAKAADTAVIGGAAKKATAGSRNPAARKPAAAASPNATIAKRASGMRNKIKNRSMR
jgi:hypothetical protein